jgi:hypothetical protein
MCAFGYIDDPNRKPILTNKNDAGITPNSVVKRFPNYNSLEITLTRMTINSLKQQLKNCSDNRVPGRHYDDIRLACKDNTYILTIDIPDNTNVVNNRATFAVSMFIITGNVVSINIIGRIPYEIVKLAPARSQLPCLYETCPPHEQPGEKTINDKIKFMVASGMRKFCQLCRPDMGPKFPQCQWKRYNSVSNTGSNAYPLATQCHASNFFVGTDTINGYCQDSFGKQAKGVVSKSMPWPFEDTHTMCGDNGPDVTNAKAYCKGDTLSDKYLCWVNDSYFFAYPDCKTTGFCCNDWSDSAQQGYTKIDKGFLVDDKGNYEKDKNGELKEAGYCNFANNALNNIIDRDSCKRSPSSAGKQKQWIQLKKGCIYDASKDGDNKYEQGGWIGGTNCCIDWSGFDGCRNSCGGVALKKDTHTNQHKSCNLINGNCVDQCKWAGETHPGKPPGFCGPNTNVPTCK